MATDAMRRACPCAGQVCGPALQARWARLPALFSDISAGSVLAAAKLMTTGWSLGRRAPAKSTSSVG